MNTLTTSFESGLIERFRVKKPGKGVLVSLQEEALRQFIETGLPKPKSEAYKFTPIARILEKNVNLSVSESISVPTAFEPHFYPLKEANHLVFVNGEYKPEHSKISSLEKDLKIQVIEDTSYEASLNMKGLGKMEIGQSDIFNTLNLGLFRSGLYLETSRKSQNLPVFLYHFVSSGSGAAFPRIFIHANELSELDVYEKVIVEGSENILFVPALEVEVKEGASVNFTKVQHYPKNVFAIESIYGRIVRDAHLYTNTYSFKAGVIRNNIGISVDGENCEAHMNGLYQLSGETHVDSNTAVDHRKPHSFSNELYKGILDEKSRAVFNGRIYVRPDAQKTNAFQSNNNILLSEGAIINTKPQLEIWADDVKCSHGCTTGQLNEEAIFYLRSRGIEKTQAKGLLLNAFANETLQSVKQDLIKAEIETLILTKLGQ